MSMFERYNKLSIFTILPYIESKMLKSEFDHFPNEA